MHRLNLNKTKPVSTKNLKLSKQKVEEISEKQYKQAMRHVDKVHKFEKEIKQKISKKEEEQIKACTFRPNLVSKYSYTMYKKKIYMKEDLNSSQERIPRQYHKQTHQRLINWGKQKDAIMRKRIITNQVDSFMLNKSMELSDSHKKSLQIDFKSQIEEDSLNITTINDILPLSVNRYKEKEGFRTLKTSVS